MSLDLRTAAVHTSPNANTGLGEIEVDALEKLAAAPKPFKVVVRYEDGKVREIPCISETAAENCARGESRRVGRDLIARDGKTVRIASVSVEKSA